LLTAAIFCALSGCQKAVKAPQEAAYAIRGDRQSTLYPVEVKQNSEDVFITLKPLAPLPEISSYDRAENKISFNFSLVGNTIVVPGKFEHLRLAQGNDNVIDIIRQHND